MSAQADDLIALVYKVVAQVLAAQPKPEAGVIVPKSYDPTTGTVQVLIGTTAAIIADTSSQPLPRPRLPLMTPVHGMQAGPVGGERCVILRTPGSAGVYLVHDTDDSPNAPAGEFHYLHRNASGATDSYFKVTNDGAATGDGLGGLRSHGGAYAQTSTGSGHAITLDDTAKRVTTTSAAGQTRIIDDTAKTITDQTSSVKTILDGNGNAISHIASTIGLGGVVSGIPATGAAVRNVDITTLTNNIMSQMMQSFASVYATAMNAAGIPQAPAFMAIVQAAGWVTSHVTPPTVPSGSAIVKIAG